MSYMGLTPEQMRDYDKERNSKPERKAYLRQIAQKPEAKVKKRAYYQERKEERRAARKTASYKEKEKRWESKPERIAWKKAYAKSEHGQRVCRNSRLRKTFGITIDDYENLLSAQGGVCAICRGVQPGGMRLAVDHCHKTKRVRGLLCTKCNRAIGLLSDSSARMQSAAEYLKKYGF